MICPNCKVECVDSICPKCNGYFDEELMAMSLSAPGGDEVDDVPGTALAVDRHHKKKVRRAAPIASDDAGHAPRRRRRAPTDSAGDDDDVVLETSLSTEVRSDASSGEQGASGGGGKYKSKYDEYWEEEEPWKKADPPKYKDANGNEVVYGQSLYTAPEEGDGNLNGLPFDPLQMAADMWSGFKALSLMEKVYSAASVAMVCLALFPWYSYRSTEEATNGFIEYGHLAGNFVVALLGALPLVGMALRKHPEWLAGFPRKFVSLLPVVAGFGGALITAVSMFYILAAKNMSPEVFAVGGSFISSCLVFLGGGGAIIFGKKER